MRPYVIAHDLGTTGNKATLYDEQGRLVGSAFSGYETEFQQTRWAEQNPQDWWQAVCLTTRHLIHETGISSDEVACVSFSGQMMGCVPVDQQGNPLRPAIIWADQRATEETAWVGSKIDPERVYRITGHPLTPSYSLAKILWIREHQPDIFRSTYRFLHAKDFVINRLTGEFSTESSDASGMNLYDLEHGAWSDEIMTAVGLNLGQLPEIKQSVDVAGVITSEAAETCGLKEGTPVIAGGGDGPCAAAGAGVVAEGSAYNYIGSSSWIAMATRQPLFDTNHNVYTFGHIVPGMVSPTGTMQAAGASFQWLRYQICGIEELDAQQSGERVYEVMDARAAQSPVGANGLIYLPYLMGERSPRWNPNARGAMIGLTIRHTRSDMIRAVLEGVALNLCLILKSFNASGAHFKEIRLIGGGARSRLWNQILADVYGVPVLRMAILEEATSMGAALAGGVAVGLYPGFEMIHQMNAIAEIFQPNQAAHDIYTDSLLAFEESYQGLLPVFNRLAR